MLKIALGDVVLSDFEVGSLDRFQKLRLQVGCDHFAARSDSPTQPFSDRAAAGANL